MWFSIYNYNLYFNRGVFLIPHPLRMTCSPECQVLQNTPYTMSFILILFCTVVNSYVSYKPSVRLLSRCKNPPGATLATESILLKSEPPWGAIESVESRRISLTSSATDDLIENNIVWIENNSFNEGQYYQIKFIFTLILMLYLPFPLFWRLFGKHFTIEMN